MSDSIQKLRKAEDEAYRDIAEARQKRVQKLKDARDEARVESEKEWQEFEKKLETLRNQEEMDAQVKQVELEAEEQIKKLSEIASLSRGEVVKMLLESVLA